MVTKHWHRTQLCVQEPLLNTEHAGPQAFYCEKPTVINPGALTSSGLAAQTHSRCHLMGSVAESKETSTKQPQFPQPLLIRLLLQTLHQLHCPSLHPVQHLDVSLVVRGPKLNTVFQVRPHQCRVQGHDHFPSPAGHTISDTSQDAIGFLGHLGTLPAHVQPAVNQHPQVLFHRAAFQPLFPKHENTLHTWVCDLAYLLGRQGFCTS
ncbi:hypothetical protein QYF61_024922 [Mycteria americana]|uniref:Uncharacterized protein n=1 Tax=Mycteria americana TaxID=33587 RepID=A0AAN7MZJ3_MYCAM|nr:hypothetical protein QYF61_024922 [Mycteria americana]